MKKIWYAVAIFVCAALLFVSCKNTLEFSEVDAKPVAEEVFADGVKVTRQFKLLSTGYTGDFSDPANALITLRFSLSVDSTSVAEGITVGKLESAADDTTPYKVTALTPKSIMVEGTKVSIRLDVTGIARIEVFLKAAHLRALNGQKLDTDEDYLQGESPDDDVYVYDTVDGAAPALTGCERNPQMLLEYAGWETGFTRSADAEGTDGYTLTLLNMSTEDFKAVLDANLEIQSYSPSSKTWKTVAKTSSTYDTANQVYKCTFAPQTTPDTSLRAYVTNAQNVVTTQPVQGFTRKLTLNGREKGFLLTQSVARMKEPAKTIVPSHQGFSLLSSTVSKRTYAIGRTCEYTLQNFRVQFNSADFISANYGSDPALYTYNGIDPATFTNENVKIALRFGDGMEYEEYALPFSSVSFEGSDTICVRVNKAVYLSNDNYNSAKIRMYVGPGLKTLPGTSDTNQEVPAYSFGQIGNFLGTDIENCYSAITLVGGEVTF